MTTVSATRYAWLDRWNKPTLPSLIDPLKVQHRRQFVALMEKLDAMDHIEQSIIWYGPSWRWTIAYNYLAPSNPGAVNGKKSRSLKSVAGGGPNALGAGAKEAGVVCYLVPRVEAPLVCVPLAEEHVGLICQGHLSRYIKEGVTTAKCAVRTRWASWSPATENEATQVFELIKRKYELLRTGPAPVAPQNN